MPESADLISPGNNSPGRTTLVLQPLAEHTIERLMPGFGQQARLLNQRLAVHQRQLVARVEKKVARLSHNRHAHDH